MTNSINDLHSINQIIQTSISEIIKGLKFHADFYHWFTLCNQNAEFEEYTTLINDLRAFKFNITRNEVKSNVYLLGSFAISMKLLLNKLTAHYIGNFNQLSNFLTIKIQELEMNQTRLSNLFCTNTCLKDLGLSKASRTQISNQKQN